MSASEDLLNLIRREVDQAATRYMPKHRFGIVAAYNPGGPSVRVTFNDDPDANGNPTLSPWMPIIEPAAGSGSGDIAAPQLGAQAIVLSFGWGADRWTFMLGTVRSNLDPVPPQPYNGDDPPPAGAPEKERWIVHPNGQGLYLRNDGTVMAGAGNGTFQRLATEDFVLSIYNGHTHEYIPGSNSPTQTEAPEQQVASDSTTYLTAQLKGT